VKPCCIASGFDTPINLKTMSIEEAFNSDGMRELRKDMVEGKRNKVCDVCYKQEDTTGHSPRLDFNKNTLWELPEIKEDYSVDSQFQHIDVRFSNLCNFKCRMCNHEFSSHWYDDYMKIKPLEVDGKEKVMKISDTISDELTNHLSNLKSIYFAGGEPLLIKEHKMFLLEIIKRGYADKISLRYNTNGILVNDEIIEIWEQFKKVKVGVSLDGIGDRVHYIRYPTDWSQVEENLWRLEQTSDKIQPNIAFAVQILNIKHVPEFIKWKVRSGFKKLNFDTNAAGQVAGGGLVGVHLLWIPTWLSLRVLPKEDKLEVRELFTELQQWLWDNYTQDAEFWEKNPYGWKRWEGILDWMDAEDHTNLLPDFRDYINTMDQQRGTDFKTVFPELAHLL
jgi:organic radical activating enzyme